MFGFDEISSVPIWRVTDAKDAIVVGDYGGRGMSGVTRGRGGRGGREQAEVRQRADVDFRTTAMIGAFLARP